MKIQQTVNKIKETLAPQRYYDNLIEHPIKLINNINKTFPNLDKRIAKVDKKFEKIIDLNATTKPILEHYGPMYSYFKSSVKLHKDLNNYDQKIIRLIENIKNRMETSNIQPSAMDRETLKDHLNNVITRKQNTIQRRNDNISYKESYIKLIAETCNRYPDLKFYESGALNFSNNILRQYNELHQALRSIYGPPAYRIDLPTYENSAQHPILPTPVENNNQQVPPDPIPVQDANPLPVGNYNQQAAQGNDQQVAQGDNINYPRPIASNPDSPLSTTATTARRNSQSH